MKFKCAFSAVIAFTAIIGTAHAGAFINGSFEDGNTVLPGGGAMLKSRRREQAK